MSWNKDKFNEKYKRENFVLKRPESSDSLLEPSIEEQLYDQWEGYDAAGDPSMQEIARSWMLNALSKMNIKSATEALEQLWWW